MVVKVGKAGQAAPVRLELDPYMGSPALGERLYFPGLRTWRVARFPLPWRCFAHGDPLEVARLPGDREGAAATFGEVTTAN